MAIVWYKDLDEETRIGVWKIEEEEEGLLTSLVLDTSESNFVDTLRKGKRTMHWLASRVLLRQLLNLQPGEFLDLRVDENEKPFLYNKSFHFSLSHSFSYAAAVVSRDHLVGCDIEQNSEKIVRIVDKFLSEDEKSFISRTDPVNHLYACWSAKEALYKLYGKKTISFKDHIHLHPFEIQFGGAIQATLKKGRFYKNFSINYELLDGYMLAYVMD